MFIFETLDGIKIYFRDEVIPHFFNHHNEHWKSFIQLAARNKEIIPIIRKTSREVIEGKM